MKYATIKKFLSRLSAKPPTTPQAADFVAAETPMEKGVFAAPTGLMCELIAFPHRVSKQAYPTSISLEQAAASPHAYEIIGIRSRRPKFSWIVADKQAGAVQSAFQLLVADDRNIMDRQQGNLWNSGKVPSSRSAQVTYQGARLLPGRVYYWSVRTWNAAGERSDYAVPQAFYVHPKEGISYYPLEKHEVLPVAVQAKADNTFFIDFGKAAFGSLSLRVYSQEEAVPVVVELGEVLASENSIHPDPGGSRRYLKTAFLLKKGTYTYQLEILPDARNTRKKAIKMPSYAGEVLPFRYASVTGNHQPIRLEEARQLVVHHPFDEEAATFHSSDPVLNKVWDLCKYSIKATSFTGIYVDGDRERVPYESDAYINQLGHYCTDREYTMARRSLEYLLHHATWPTEWILHSVLMAYADYMYTGDLSLIEKYFKLLKAKALLGLAREDGLISTRTGKTTRRVERSVKYEASQFKGKKIADIVDWPQPGSLDLQEGDPGETDGFEFCAINTVVNAFHYRTLVLMGRMATALGKTEEAVFFQERAGKVKTSFHQKLFNQEQGLYVDGEGSAHSSLHANMFPLAFGLVPEAHVASVVNFIQSRGMACSVYGAQYLLESLYRAGEASYAASLLTSQEDRSWYHMIQAGSTITMEAWDDQYKPNQDWNHAWGAAPANIIPRFLMGVRPLEPGFAKVLIQPQPGPIQHASLKLPTIRGTIQVAWEMREERFQLDISLPANMQARVALPFSVGQPFRLTLNNTIVSAQQKGKFVVWESLGSGTHTFVLTYDLKPETKKTNG